MKKYKGYIIKPALPSGGKAGKGFNKTSTIQVVDPFDNRLMKHFRFEMNNESSRQNAIQKAIRFIDQKLFSDSLSDDNGAL